MREISKNAIIFVLMGLFLIIAAIMAYNFKMMEKEIQDLEKQIEEKSMGNMALKEAILILENDKQVLSDRLVSLDSVVWLQKKKIDYYYDFYRKNIPMGITIYPDEHITIPFKYWEGNIKIVPMDTISDMNPQ